MNHGARRWWLGWLFFVSGAPGLMAQLAWVRVLGAGLGHEFPALAGVVAAYFLGLAAGAVGFARWGARGIRPERIYAGLEIGSGLWILATTPLLTPALELARHWLGPGAAGWREFLVEFGFPALVIGPAAAAMGATFPAMERAMAPLERDGRAVPGLYALNTAGAILGIGAAIGVLMPTLGFRATLGAAALVQLACGGVALFISRQGDSVRGPARPPAKEPWPGARNPRREMAVVAAFGFLGLGFELLGVRALAQTTENTVRTYAVVLASVLAGTVAGAAWNRRQILRGREWNPVVLLGGTSVACGMSIWAMGWSGAALNALRGMGWGWVGELIVSAAVFVPPSAGMGMVFSHWVQRASGGKGGVARAVAWNCLGAALAGPALVGAAVPVLGLKTCLFLTAGGYLALVPWRSWIRGAWGLPVAMGCLAAGAPWGVRFLELPAGASIVRSWDGRMASVAVIRTGDGERVLRVNNHFQQGGTATALAARRHAHLPLLLHPRPRTALFLGIGTGITLGAAADHPGLQAEGVELLPEVIRALPEFGPENRSPQSRPGFQVVTGDARRHVRTVDRNYDVIVADLFHPAEDGAGMLYTREHFRAIRDRLNPGGLFCQWLPLHQLDEEGFRDVGVTFLEVFPEASLWLLRFNVDVPVVGLIGGDGPWLARPRDTAQRQAAGDLAPALKAVGLGDPVRLLGCRIADTPSLRLLARGGRVATDDLPRVLHGAARAVYRELGPPHERLLGLLATADPGFEECLAPADQETWLKRLIDFRSARDRHLGGLGKESEGRLREALDDYVASAEFSADYTAGYAQAVVVASAYFHEDPELARRVLERLVAVRPEQGLARELLGRLGP